MKIFEIWFEKYGAFMTPNEAAKELRMHPNHVRDLINIGEIPAVKISSRWRIPTEKLAEMFKGN